MIVSRVITLIETMGIKGLGGSENMALQSNRCQPPLFEQHNSLRGRICILHTGDLPFGRLRPKDKFPHPFTPELTMFFPGEACPAPYCRLATPAWQSTAATLFDMSEDTVELVQIVVTDHQLALLALLLDLHRRPEAI